MVLSPLVGSDHDEVWQGGFEESFPNDEPTAMGNVFYLDHGELRFGRMEGDERGSRLGNFSRACSYC